MAHELSTFKCVSDGLLFKIAAITIVLNVYCSIVFTRITRSLKFNLTSPCLSISNGWNFRKFKGDFLIGKPQKGKIE